ncbi:MAG TPA: substrate-binding domain-containing protein, partial [Actinocrinis sp.]
GITLLMPVPFTGAEGLGRYLASQAVDGVLLLSMPANHPLLRDLLTRRMPTVAAGAPVGFERQISYVTVDNREAAREMVRYLHACGRRRIATITGPLDTDGGVMRLAGYRDVVGEIDERYVVTGDYSRSGGEAAMDRLLDQAADLDAVFVASDLMAVGALAALRRRGRTVPREVAVAGFDDGHAATTAQPGLTTIRQPWQRIGVEMVRLLLGVIAGERQSAVILPHELIVRSSA